MTPAAANATATSPFAWLLRELLPAPDAAQLGLLDQELPETEGGASSSVLFEPLTDLGFSFKSYEVQSNARAVMVTLSLNNIFAFPVRVHTGAYPIACVLGAGGARDDASPAAARATVGAQDASVMPRNAWHVAVLVEVEDAEQIGRDLISPALVGVPVSVRLRVAGNAPRPSAGMQLAQWALQRVFPDGAWLRPGSTPPVAAAVNMLDSLDLSFSGADLGLKMTLVVPIPGIKLYVPWEVPRITLTLAPPGGAGADAPDPSTDVVATFAVSPGFLYTTAELDVTIKDVDNRCSPLLSAIAFNVAAALPGSLRVGDELVPFPITLRLRPGLFLNSSLLGPADGRSTFEGPVVMSVQEGDGFCGVSAANGSTLGIHGHVCNRQGRTIRARLTDVQGYVMSRIAKERLRCRHCLARIAGPISFPLPRLDAAGDDGVRFGPDECVAVSSQGPVYATTSSHNATCEMHRLAASEHADAAEGLRLLLTDVTVGSLCTCRDGINKCSQADADTDGKWKCDPASAARKVRLCLG